MRTCADLDIPKTTLPDIPLVIQTEHLDIYSERFVCAGTAVELEKHAQFIAETVGVELRNHIPLVFTEDSPESCSGTPDGCTKPDGAAFGIPEAMRHELGHAVACQLHVYRGARTVEEGFAVMFDPAHRTNRSDNYVLEKALESELGSYNYGGHFMRWLYETEGGEAVGEFYRRHTTDTVVAVIEDMLGAPVEAIDEEFMATSPYQYVPFHYCGMDLPHIEPDADGVWRFDSIFDCDDESTMGPYLWDSSSYTAEEVSTWMYQSFTVDIDESNISLGYDVSDDIRFAWMWRCPEEHPNDPEPELNPWEGGIIEPISELGAKSVPLVYNGGRYRIDVIRKHGPAVATSLHFWKEPWPF